MQTLELQEQAGRRSSTYTKKRGTVSGAAVEVLVACVDASPSSPMSPQRKLRATLDSRLGRTGPWCCYTVKHFFTVSGICSVRLARALSLQTGVPHFMTTSAFNYREMKTHKQPMSSRSKMDNVSLNVFTAGDGQKRLLYQKGGCDTHTHTLWQCLSLLHSPSVSSLFAYDQITSLRAVHVCVSKY